MNKKLTLKYLGYLMVIEGAFMIPAMLIALIRTETPATFGFAGTIAVLLAIGGPLLLLKAENQTLYAKDGFFIVALSWIVLSLFGALPFRISGAIPSFVDAFFETVSGFTTTGASILLNRKAPPQSRGERTARSALYRGSSSPRPPASLASYSQDRRRVRSIFGASCVVLAVSYITY